MRVTTVRLCAGALALSLTLGCESEPVAGDDGSGTAGTNGSGGAASGRCSAALKQSLSLVDRVSTGVVAPLEAGAETLLYVDATAGGLDGSDEFPWIYLSLATSSAVPLTDLEAMGSKAWDLALKRFVIRTNGGDSGPGAGGALRVALPWDAVDASTQGDRQLPTEQWFDEDCNLTTGDTGDLLTTFSGWYEYDPGSHRLTAIDAVYLVQGADGTAYKLAVLDYYARADGSTGGADGHYKLRVAPLP